MVFEWSRMIEGREFTGVFYALATSGAAAFAFAAAGYFEAAFAICAAGAAISGMLAVRRSKRIGWAAFGAAYIIAPSIALIWLGVNVYPPLLWVGLGMTAYGVAYFAFHDLIVHRRVRVPYKPRDGYMQRIVAAHRMHHATRERDGAVSFGFLWAPPIERLKRQREELARARHVAED